MIYTVVVAGVRHYMTEIVVTADSPEEAEALATQGVAGRKAPGWQNSDGQMERTSMDGMEILEVREGQPPRHPERIVPTEAG